MPKIMIFDNQRFFKKQKFEILRSGLKISKQTVFDSIEYEIPFEKIHNKLKVQTNTNNGLLVTSFFFIITGLIMLASGNKRVAIIFFASALITVIIAFATILKIITIDCYDSDKIELYFKKNNKESVVQFANQIINSSNSYLYNKYSKIDKALPVESQLINLEFLRNKEIINEEDFETLKNQLLGRENKSSIGFNQ
jgi:hypothetical protein